MSTPLVPIHCPDCNGILRVAEHTPEGPITYPCDSMRCREQRWGDDVVKPAGPSVARCAAAPTHPSPADMARGHVARSHRTDVNFKDGIEAERARMAAHLRALVDEHREEAKRLNDPAPANLSAALEAAEHIGAGLALLELARELDAK